MELRFNALHNKKRIWIRMVWPFVIAVIYVVVFRSFVHEFTVSTVVFMMLPLILLFITAQSLDNSYFNIALSKILLSPEGVECSLRGKYIKLSWSDIVEVGVGYSAYGDGGIFKFKDSVPEYVLKNSYLYFSTQKLDALQRETFVAAFRSKKNNSLIAVSVDGQETEIESALEYIKTYYHGEILIESSSLNG